MPTPTCAKCRRTIPGDDINVAQDVAYCRTCNISYQLSELTHDNDIAANLDLQHPPKGAWYVSDGSGTVIGATDRDLFTGAFMLCVALFWNSIVSVFVAMVLASTLQHLNLPLPHWFPAPKMDGGDEMGVGMTIFLWLFLTPFIFSGVFFLWTALSSFFGRTEVRITNSQGTIFTGIGPLGWRKRFEIAQVRTVKLDKERSSRGADTLTIMIELQSGKQIKFGSALANERRQFVLAALKKTVLS